MHDPKSRIAYPELSGVSTISLFKDISNDHKYMAIGMSLELRPSRNEAIAGGYNCRPSTMVRKVSYVIPNQGMPLP